MDDFILGAEESYGYLSGTYVRDKDGVNAALLICEMFAYYKSKGKNLLQILDELYDQYGYFVDLQRNYSLEGAEGFRNMQTVIENLRQNNKSRIFGFQIKTVTDYKSGTETDFEGNKVTKTGLPSSNVLKKLLEQNLSFVFILIRKRVRNEKQFLYREDIWIYIFLAFAVVINAGYYLMKDPSMDFLLNTSYWMYSVILIWCFILDGISLFFCEQGKGER